MHDEELTGIIVDEAFQLHKDLGPGLLESVYNTLLAHRLRRRGLTVEQEKWSFLSTTVSYSNRDYASTCSLRVVLWLS